jgi:hypothetical protein
MPASWPTTRDPILTWSVSGTGYTQSVTGPGLTAQTAPGGSVGVCPKLLITTAGAPVCSPGAGQFSYELQVFDANGNVVFDRTVTLTARG